MCEEKITLEKIIDKETEKVREKYKLAENLLEDFDSWKVHDTTGIDYETIKLIDLRRKKINQRKELLREITDLNYEIGFQMGLEEGRIIANYKIAKNMLEDEISINDIINVTNLTEDEIKLIQTI